MDEEEYLLKSVSKLVARWMVTQGTSRSSRSSPQWVILSPCTGEAKKLLPHLFQFSEAHRREGEALQQALSAFDEGLREAIEAIWKQAEAEQEQSIDSWAVRMQQKEREGLVDPIERVPKPEIGNVEFGLDLLRMGRKRHNGDV